MLIMLLWESNVRRVNAFISKLILILFLIHAIGGSFQLFGFIAGGNVILEILSYTMLALVCVHAVIGICLTVKTLVDSKEAGAMYSKESRLFWTRRITGFCMIVFAAIHVFVFIGTSNGAFRLRSFDVFELICMILLIASLFIHILCNIKPLMISFGLMGFKIYIRDILFVLSAVLLLALIAFIVYFVRWQII